MEAGPRLPVLFQYLKESKTPFIYACGNQKEALDDKVKTTLAEAEQGGFAIAPNWVDQIGVLAHPVRLLLTLSRARSNVH